MVQDGQRQMLLTATDTAGGVWQIFAFIGVVESFSYEKNFYGTPGDGNLGFDPLQLGKNPASLAYYKVRMYHAHGCVRTHMAARSDPKAKGDRGKSCNTL